ncbi:AAA domain-containing protein [Spirosoma sp. KNUC1025]|uniref:AAA domain-containing protein n=1 Tax=Spirosoma sp. KNUC1025 TaxID=2894082 RepID=UPI0038637B1A|nr:AAA domain-containing protein [Spirosoma sp. KNUC1025]
MTSLPAGQFLDLHEVDFLLNKSSFTIITELIGRKPSVVLCEVLDARQERSNEVSRKLRRIDRTARFIEEERGTEDLYVGWPFVKGKFLDETVVHGPLLFFPVKIEHQGKFWKLTRRGDELAFLNPTLALAYGQFNQVSIPDEVVERTLDDLDRDPLVFRTQLYEWLKTTPLEINFNQDLFTDKLQFFNKQTAKDLTQLERTGELKLYPEAVLGIFPQAGSFLVPDYDTLIGEEEARKESDNGVSNSDNFSPLLPFFPSSNLLSSAFLPEKSIHTPLPMDASQEAALRAVKAGQSLVVQGPPGTGKSQLIANLMADAAAAGKRVLLVCQKRAALDVVQERLRQVGMAPFLALIHDFQDDRRALYTQIADQINQIEAYRQQNNSLNAVLLERDFEAESRRIDETVAELQRFKEALFDTSECGFSAKELYLTTSSATVPIPLDDIYSQFSAANVDNFVRRLSDYAAYQQRLGPNHSWSERVSFATFSNADSARAEQVINHWIELRTDSRRHIQELTGSFFSLKQLADWQAHDWELTALLNLLDSPDADRLWEIVRTLQNVSDHPALSAEEAKFEQIAQAWDDTLVAPGPELSLLTTDLRAFRAVLSEAISARSSWVSWQWWQLTNAGKEQLLSVLDDNKLSTSEADLQLLATKIEKRIRLEATRFEASTLLSGLNLPETSDSIRFLRRAQHITERLKAIEPLQVLPESSRQNPRQFIDAVKRLLRFASDVEQMRITAQTYLTTNQIERIWEDDVVGNTLRQSLRNDFDLLVESDRLQEGFSEGEKTVIERLTEHNPVEWSALFQTSLRRAWLDHIESVHPDLRSVSSLKMNQWEQSLQESILRKQSLSRDILLVKLREQTYRNLTLNRLNNVTTYRDLLHQTTKKRNVWPVRKLMESFADEVFKLVPCWLASPESVSAMFPLREGLFDLVIFDEASQCFAENGVPAIIRGRQVVVTGDNQQLRPSDLYRIRLDDADQDEEVPVALEVESLLELAAQQLPQISLTEHYRSRSLELITFSNEHFYQSKLSLLPHFEEINRREPAIRYLNVKGTWQQNTNPTEAEAVLQLLNEFITELPGRSIGIVTFNYPQQQLIQDMLENATLMGNGEVDQSINSHNTDKAADLHLFVKNIENVQGDERDVIIFSIGYAPDERGRISANFGSLNARGGENRLNVAVTRARERIYVVTSLWPEQLNVADAANEGPKLLKSYLEYALTVAQEQFQPAPVHQQSLPSNVLLKTQLARKHPEWQPELPFADLTVKSGAMYESLILTDDDAYYQQTSKQAHAYLPIALHTRKWPFQRVWSREFWRKAQ